MPDSPNTEDLQDVMRAMDTIDELRHANRLVERAMQAGDRKSQLIDRLRDIYAEQGVDVSDTVIEQGVAALDAQRFTYRRSGGSWQRLIARIYIQRSRWWKPLTLAMLAAVALWWTAGLQRQLPMRTAPSMLGVELRKQYVQAVSAADWAADGMQYMNRIDALNHEGKTALDRGDHQGASQALQKLERLNDHVNATYRLQIVLEPDQPFVVTRPGPALGVPPAYYLLVEPVNNLGWPVEVDVFSQDTGQRERVMRYGQQISAELAQRLEAEFAANGRPASRTVGHKQSGAFAPRFDIDVQRRVITQW